MGGRWEGQQKEGFTPPPPCLHTMHVPPSMGGTHIHRWLSGSSEPKGGRNGPRPAWLPFPVQRSCQALRERQCSPGKPALRTLTCDWKAVKAVTSSLTLKSRSVPRTGIKHHEKKDSKRALAWLWDCNSIVSVRVKAGDYLLCSHCLLASPGSVCSSAQRQRGIERKGKNHQFTHPLQLYLLLQSMAVLIRWCKIVAKLQNNLLNDNKGWERREQREYKKRGPFSDRADTDSLHAYTDVYAGTGCVWVCLGLEPYCSMYLCECVCLRAFGYRCMLQCVCVCVCLGIESCSSVCVCLCTETCCSVCVSPSTAIASFPCC